MHYKYKKERVLADQKSNEEDRRKSSLIIDLSNSRSFANTHSIIRRMKKISMWTEKEKETLFDIAIHNNQVLYILQDFDVKTFYKKLLSGNCVLSPNAQAVKDTIEAEE